MRKILTAVIVAASVGAAAIATPSPAKAWWGWGPAVVGGVVAGAIVGGAIASRPYYYPYYGPYRIPITDRAVASGTVTLGCPPVRGLSVCEGPQPDCGDRPGLVLVTSRRESLRAQQCLIRLNANPSVNYPVINSQQGVLPELSSGLFSELPASLIHSAAA